MSFLAKYEDSDGVHPIAATLYGTCSTAANVAEKEVTLPDCDALIEGMSVVVKFGYGNTAANPTLNINGLGPVEIIRYQTSHAGTTPPTSWAAGAMIQFTYAEAYRELAGVGESVSSPAMGGGSGTSGGSSGTSGGFTSQVVYGFFINNALPYNDLLSAIYPVGSIYMSVNSVSPATLFGGTWEQIQDTFLLAAGSSYAAGATGGSADAIVPSHRHSVEALQTDTNYHYHDFGKTSSSATPPSTSYRVLKTTASSVSTTGVTTGSVGKVPMISGSAFSFYSDTTTEQASHNHTILSHYTNTTGSEVTGANMPPYLAVYVWKRVS